jgi:hypothetical protein
MRVGREPVVRAGLKLLDRVGLEGLTPRAIGAELGIRAPTLYCCALPVGAQHRPEPVWQLRRGL